MGARRVQAIQASLANLLGRRASPVPETASLPSVKALLEVDRSYREKAAAGELPTIAPRRFNPQSEAWLPVMHSTLGHWHFTALYSNTARAHQLHRTHDWVLIYYYDDEHHEYQNTVVTETHGQYKGLRVVRGREAECGEFYTSREGRT
jgi:putative hydrolase